MKFNIKKLIGILCMIVVLVFNQTSVFAQGDSESTKVIKNLFYINGFQDIYHIGFNVQGRDYYNIYEIAELTINTTANFNVKWNSDKKVLEIVRHDNYIKPKEYKTPLYNYTKIYPNELSKTKVMIDNNEFEFKTFVNEGIYYFNLDDISTYLNFFVEVDKPGNRIGIFANKPDNAHELKHDAYKINRLNTGDFWNETNESYMFVDDNNNLNTVEIFLEINTGKPSYVLINTLDSDYHIAASKSVPFELDFFGAFYYGEKYNYIAFGQRNEGREENKEVVRVVRYDKSFNKIDSVSVKGGESLILSPFNAGCGRIEERNDELIYHTSRIIYYGHQVQFTVVIDTKNMKIKNDLGQFQDNFVSHSFDQYVKYDGDKHVLLDHGDAGPRAIVLNKFNGNGYDRLDLLDIPGEIGDNYTGVSLGGLQVSSSKYLVALNSIEHDLTTGKEKNPVRFGESERRDIILYTVDKNNLKENHINTRTVAKYVGSNKTCSVPQLLKINDNKFILMWTEFEATNIVHNIMESSLKYVYLDENGNNISEIKTVYNFVLSKCEPIIYNNSLVWYIDEKFSRLIYSIPIE